MGHNTAKSICSLEKNEMGLIFNIWDIYELHATPKCIMEIAEKMPLVQGKNQGKVAEYSPIFVNFYAVGL